MEKHACSQCAGPHRSCVDAEHGEPAKFKEHSLQQKRCKNHRVGRDSQHHADKSAKQQMREEWQERRDSSKTYLFDSMTPELKSHMEDIRLGRKKKEEL